MTEPKYENEFENPVLEEEVGEKSRRRLSGISSNEDEAYGYGEKLYQHKKSASTTMAMKMLNRFQKKGSTPVKA